MKYNKFIIAPCVSLCMLLFGCNNKEPVDITNVDIQTESLYLRNSNHSYTTNNIKKLYEEKIKKEEEIKLKEQKAKEEQEKKEKNEKEKLAENLDKNNENSLLSNDNKQDENNILEDNKNENIKYSPNTIGINGIFKKFIEVGETTYTPTIQNHLNNGEIVASLTYYNSNDGQTTYFSGHNPGVFTYMYENINIGSIITVVDTNNIPTNYVALEGVYVDKWGETYIKSVGNTARNLYNYGSNRESIAIQYCLGDTMMTWYCEKQ